MMTQGVYNLYYYLANCMLTHCIYPDYQGVPFALPFSTSAAVPIVCLVSLHSLCDRNKAEQFVRGDLHLYNRWF